VSEPARYHNAVIVEEDVGFLLWLGQLLADAGYRTIPASNCRQAMTHIRELGIPIHLAVLDLKLRGATSMLQTLEAAHRGLRIVVIGDPAGGVPARIPASAILEKPRNWANILRGDWLQRINQALADAPEYASSR
jgi:DNA-binding NtrC family response regulator